VQGGQALGIFMCRFAFLWHAFHSNSTPSQRPASQLPTMADDNPADPWKYSKARDLLEKDIKDGTVDATMHPAQVFIMRPEFSEFDYDFFAKRLETLQESLGELKTLAHIDARALAHDLALGMRKNSKPYPLWQGSCAERLLKEDLDDGLDLIMKPEKLKGKRPEYDPWPLDVFRNHIHQELRARKERPYWLGRRKHKEEEKRNAVIEKAKAADERAKKKAAKDAAKEARAKKP